MKIIQIKLTIIVTLNLATLPIQAMLRISKCAKSCTRSLLLQRSLQQNHNKLRLATLLMQSRNNQKSHKFRVPTPSKTEQTKTQHHVVRQDLFGFLCATAAATGIGLVCYYFSQNPLHRAIEKGDVEALRAILSKNKELVNKPYDHKIRFPWQYKKVQEGGYKSTVSIMGETRSYEKSFEKLVWNYPESWHVYPLTHAVVNGNVEIVRELLEGGANPNTSESPLIFSTPNLEIMSLLIDYGADVNQKRNPDIYIPTPLFEAVHLGESQAVTLLLQRDADAQIKWQGITPLDYAIKCYKKLGGIYPLTDNPYETTPKEPQKTKSAMDKNTEEFSKSVILLLAALSGASRSQLIEMENELFNDSEESVEDSSSPEYKQKLFEHWTIIKLLEERTR